MKHIIKHRQITADDSQHLGDDDTLPAVHGPTVTVSLQRWLREREQLNTYRGRVGVRLEGDEELALLLPDLPVLELIALDFLRFTDGRCYSQARLLRERYGYEGELRAIGDVLQDQLSFMARCGIDAFELRAGQNPERALTAFAEFSVHYQPTGSDSKPADDFHSSPQEALS